MPKVSEAHLAGRRRQILDAARRCFARDGFHAASMQDVVRESGTSSGAIYRYFQSKDEIIEAIARERHARESELLAAVRKDAEGVAALREIAHLFLGSLERTEERQDRRLGLQLWAEALRSPALLRLVREGVDRPRAILVEILQAARERGELPDSVDPDAAARLVIAIFHGVLLQKTWDPRVSLEPLLGLVDLLLANLGARTPA